MVSGFKIRQIDHALFELSETVKYLEENWTEKELIQFANAVDNTVEIISRHPEIYPVSNKKRKIRKAVVDKNNIIYYRVVKDSIQILSVFGTKQDPAKRKQKTVAHKRISCDIRQQQVFVAESTRLASMTDEDAEGKIVFLEKMKPYVKNISGNRGQVMVCFAVENPYFRNRNSLILVGKEEIDAKW